MISKHVLYLTYDGLTDPLGQSQILPYLIGLSKVGYTISVVSFEKKEAYNNNAETIQKICADSFIHWIPLKYTKRPPILSTLKDIYLLRREVKRIQRSSAISIIHCRSYITALVGLWSKRKWGTKFIFDMRGFWADERVDGGLWDLNRRFYRIIYNYFKKKESQFLSEANYTISLTYNAKNEIYSNLLPDKKIAPIEVIPCCVDLELFDVSNILNKEIFNKKEELNIPKDGIVLSYIGSIGTWYLLKDMLSFFSTWLTHYPQSIFLFVTNDQPDIILDQAKQLKISELNIRIIKGKRSEMPILIACSDYSIFFIKPAYSKIASSPTKQGEIMAMGKPVICNAHIGDTDFIINKYNSGIIITELNTKEYFNAIQELKIKSFDQKLIRMGAEEFYSLKNGVQKYKNVYEELLSK